MSHSSPSRRILHLAVGGFPVSRLNEITGPPPTGDMVEIFVLTEANAREVVEKIFSTDGIAVWGPITGQTEL